VSQTKSFDRVLVIDGGKIIEDAAPEVLLNDATSRYHDYLDADKVVQQELWTGAEWRHLSIAGGRLSEFEAAQGTGE
jgi:ATP-binding cassette subfamily B protein